MTSNSIAKISNIASRVPFPPLVGAYKVCVIIWVLPHHEPLPAGRGGMARGQRCEPGFLVDIPARPKWRYTLGTLSPDRRLASVMSQPQASMRS